MKMARTFHPESGQAEDSHPLDCFFLPCLLERFGGNKNHGFMPNAYQLLREIAQLHGRGRS
jgi:hypothetical protein